MLGKGVGADITQYINVAVVAVFKSLQAAIFVRAHDEDVHFIKQAIVQTWDGGPCQVLRVTKVKGYADIGEINLVHRQFVGVDHC